MNDDQKINLNKLFYAIIGFKTQTFKEYQEIPDTEAIIVRAKYSFFCKGKIRYFVNPIDNTKYYPKDKIYSGLCAAYYAPVTAIIDGKNIIENRYARYGTIVNGAKIYTSKIKNQIKEETNIENNDSKKTNYFNYNYYERKSKNSDCSPEMLGTVLTDQYYISEPIVGRTKELEELINSLANRESNPILVGPSGVGKTVLVDELAYRIQNGNVPNFLKGKKIIKVHAGELVSGTIYRGSMEEKVINFLNYINSIKAILFIDEVHAIFGAGETIDGSLDVAELLKNAIDKTGFEVICATTDKKYRECVVPRELNKQLDPTIVEEPNTSLLYDIICQKFDYYAKCYNISPDKINNAVIDILIELTNPKHRKYDDEIYNPSLVLGIISKAFARANAADSPVLNYADIMASIESNRHIYPSAKATAIEKIEELTDEKEQSKGRILVFKP